MSETHSRGEETGGTAGAGLKSSMAALAATVLDMVRTRVELLSIEIEEEKRRLIGILAWGATGILLGGFGLVFLAIWMTVWLWDTHRLLTLGVCAAAFLGMAAWALWRVRSLLGASEAWLSATLGELDVDRQALTEGLAAHHHAVSPASHPERSAP